AFSPTEQFLALVGREQLSLHWLGDGRAARLGLPEGFTRVFVSITFNRAGDEIRLVSRDGRLARVGLTTGPLTLQMVGRIEVPGESREKLALSPDRERLALLVPRPVPAPDNEAAPGVEWWLEVYDFRAECVARARVAVGERPGFGWMSDGLL